MALRRIEFGSLEAETSPMTIAAGGDILVRDGITRLFREGGAQHLFSGLRPHLRRARVVFANLETPLTASETKNPGKDPSLPFMKARPDLARALAAGPVTLVSLANNHILDFGAEGLHDTIAALGKQKVDWVGAGLNEEEARRPRFYGSNGVTVGFLAYSNAYYAVGGAPGCAPAREEVMLDDIARWKGSCDHLFISAHQGVVYSDYPLPEHVRLYRRLIDAGASVILGHHPHVLQGVEEYNGGVIFYSLNSWIFDYTREEDDAALRTCTMRRAGGFSLDPRDARAREGLLAMFGLDKNTVRVELVPVVQENLDIPRPAEGARKTAVLERLRNISDDLSKPDLPVWDILRRLSAEENIGGLRELGVFGALKRLHRLRGRHLRYAYEYALARLR